MARYTGLAHTDGILEIAAEWRDRCLIGDGGMLGGGDVWTPQNAEAFKQHFVENLDTSADDFVTKLRGQIGDQPPGVVRLAAEELWVVYLFPRGNPGPDLRRQRLKQIWSWCGSNLPDTSYIADDAFAGLVNGGRAFTSQAYHQLTLLGRAVAALKALPAERRAELTRDGDPFEFASWLDGVAGASTPSMRHMLLYLCRPDSFERIISATHKRLIVKTFGKTPPKKADKSEDYVAIDRELLAIRQRKAAELGTTNIDFYIEPLRGEWHPEEDDSEASSETTGAEADGKTMPIRRIVVRRPEITLDELAAELAALGMDLKRSTVSTIRADARATIKAAREEGRWNAEPTTASVSDLASIPGPEDASTDGMGGTAANHLSGVFIDEAASNRILAALRHRKNVILQGAPGVGKTFAARKLAMALGAPQDAIDEVQFHQAYGYEDFIEGFRPEAGGGFALRPGRLKLICEAAKSRSAVPHVLIVDEINRGNVSRILGEALVLLEADKRGERHALLLAQGGARFWLPPNLHLLGLMNTADRSLAMVDYAIRRRFAFFTIEPAFASAAFADALSAVGVGADMIVRVRERVGRLNERIAADTAALGPGYRIGHSYFLGSDTDGDDDGWYRGIVESQIAPLLHEYWADTPSKAAGEVEALLADH